MIFFQIKNNNMAKELFSDSTHKMLMQVSTVLMIIVAALTIHNFMQIRKQQLESKKATV
jgi:hypothetical protein